MAWFPENHPFARRSTLTRGFALITGVLVGMGYANETLREQQIRVEKLTGEAEYLPAGGSLWEAVSPKSVISGGASLKTREKSQVHLTTESGDSIIVGESSTVRILKAQYQVERKFGRVKVGLQQGTAWIEMPAQADEINWFDIETPQALIYLRSAKTKVHSGDNKTDVSVYAGTVKMRSTIDGNEVVIKPNKKGIAYLNQKRMDVVELIDNITMQAATSAPAHQKAPDEISIAMLSLQSRVAEKEDLLSIADFISTEMEKNTKIKVFHLDHVMSMLEEEGSRELIECQKDSCLSEIASSLGADFVVIGNIGQLGSRFVFNLKLIDVMRNDTENRVSSVASNDVGLFIDQIPGLVNKLVPENLHKKIAEAKPQVAAPANLPKPADNTKIPDDMVWIPGGTFMMGAKTSDTLASRENDEWPPHQVTLSGFFMDKFEVTRQDFLKVMQYNPSAFKGCQNCPVDNVSWDEAEQYCKKVGKRLPTEAEWEYAARAGSDTEFHFGRTLTSDQANFNGQFPFGGASPGKNLQRLVPVGSFQPNNWGLYDMHGNVWEWCNDWYEIDYYKSAPESDPKGPSKSMYRVLRGGSWQSEAKDLRSVNRWSYRPSVRLNTFGFRCAKDASKEQASYTIERPAE